MVLGKCWLVPRHVYIFPPIASNGFSILFLTALIHPFRPVTCAVLPLLFSAVSPSDRCSCSCEPEDELTPLRSSLVSVHYLRSDCATTSRFFNEHHDFIHRMYRHKVIMLTKEAVNQRQIKC
jgi:hypothetical protein